MIARSVRAPSGETGDLSGLSLLRQLFREERVGLLAGSLAGLVWMGARVAVPKCTQLAIDRGIAPGDTQATIAWALAILAVGCVAAVFTGIRHWYANIVAKKTERRVRQRLFVHYQRLHVGFHDGVPVGDLMGRANSDLAEIERLTNLAPSTIAAFVGLLAVTAILFATNAGLAALSLSTIVLLVVTTVRFAKLLQPASAAVQLELAALGSVVEDTVSGMRVVKGLGAEETQRQKLHEVTDSIYEHSIALARIRAAYLPAYELLPLVGIAIVLVVGGGRVLDGTMTVGQIVGFSGYLLMLVYPMQRAGLMIPQLQRTLVASRRIAAVLSVEPAIAEQPDAVEHPDGPGAVRFEHVWFGYPPVAGQPALLDFDLSIEPGTSVALVGATGCGKSTVTRLLLRFYDAQEGRIAIDGHDVRHLRSADLRKLIAVVFEDSFLFEDTVAANIALGNSEAPRELVERAARLASADGFISALPDGYETLLGERGYSLSGGQRQRLAIARAILADPRVLILDDATSAIDSTREHEIRQALVEVMKGRVTIVIAHRPATIALVDRVVMLDRGRIVADGAHEDLLATNATYARFLTGRSAAS